MTTASCIKSRSSDLPDIAFYSAEDRAMKIVGNRLAAVPTVACMRLLVNINAFERSFAMQVAWPS